MLLFGVILIAQNYANAEEPNQLISLRNAYADAHVETMEPLTKKYLAALAALREKLAKSGDLEGALVVKSEEEGTNKTEESKQPRQLVALNRIYNVTKDRKSREVTEKYINALHALQLKLTKSGDLEGAQKVKIERQKYITEKKSSDKEESSNTVKLSKREFTKLMISGGWEWRSSHKFSGKANLDDVRFSSDGRCNIEWIWKWEIDGSGSIKVTFHDRNYYVFDMDFKKNRGVSNIEKGTIQKEDKKRASIVLKK